MSTPEGRFKDKLKKILKKHNFSWVMVVTKGFGNNGVSDFICNVNGMFVAIETKAKGNTATKLQSLYLDRKVAACNGWGFVASPDGLRVVRPSGSVDAPDLLLSGKSEADILKTLEAILLRIAAKNVIGE